MIYLTFNDDFCLVKNSKFMELKSEAEFSLEQEVAPELQPQSQIADLETIAKLLEFDPTKFHELCFNVHQSFLTSGKFAQIQLDQIFSSLCSWRLIIRENQICMKFFSDTFIETHIGDVLIAFLNPDLDSLFPPDIHSDFFIKEAFYTAIRFICEISYYQEFHSMLFWKESNLYQRLYEIFFDPNLNYDRDIAHCLLATMINLCPVEKTSETKFQIFDDPSAVISRMARIFVQFGFPFVYLWRLLWNVSKDRAEVFNDNIASYLSLLRNNIDEDSLLYAFKFAINVIKMFPDSSIFFLDYFKIFMQQISEYGIETAAETMRFVNIVLIQIPETNIFSIFDVWEDFNSVFELLFNESATCHQVLLFISEVANRKCDGVYLLQSLLTKLEISAEQLCINVTEAYSNISIYGKDEIIEIFNGISENLSNGCELALKYLDPAIIADALQSSNPTQCISALTLLWRLIRFVKVNDTENFNSYLQSMNELDIPEMVEDMLDNENEEIAFNAKRVTDIVQ